MCCSVRCGKVARLSKSAFVYGKTFPLFLENGDITQMNQPEKLGGVLVLLGLAQILECLSGSFALEVEVQMAPRAVLTPVKPFTSSAKS